MNEDSVNDLDGYDIFAGAYQQDPAAFWKALSERKCPVAHTGEWGGAWMVVNYQDVYDVVQNPEVFSSRAVEVAGEIPAPGKGLLMPPITSAPPEHADHRALLEPFLSPAAVRDIEPFLRGKAQELAGTIARKGGGDAAAEFARPLALSALTNILAVPAEMQDQFVDWATRVLRVGPMDQAIRRQTLQEIMNYLDQLTAERRGKGGTDMVSRLADATLDGAPLPRKHLLGSLMEIVIAGADSTWSTMGASLWHLASNPSDRAMLAANPGALKTGAIEEFLRVFAPVTIARITTQETELHGRCVHADERVIMPLAAANRDPAVFEEADTVKLDRRRNRHIAFGTGAHRCLGAHLARAELNIALEEWLKAIPEFELVDPESVAWTQGQIRGPESVPIRIP